MTPMPLIGAISSANVPEEQTKLVVTVSRVMKKDFLAQRTVLAELAVASRM